MKKSFKNICLLEKLALSLSGKRMEPLISGGNKNP